MTPGTPRLTTFPFNPFHQKRQNGYKRHNGCRNSPTTFADFCVDCQFESERAEEASPEQHPDEGRLGLRADDADHVPPAATAAGADRIVACRTLGRPNRHFFIPGIVNHGRVARHLLARDAAESTAFLVL